MIKKLILILFVTISAVAFGQTNSENFNKFILDITQVESQYREYYNNKEYKQTAILLQEMLGLVENLKLTPDEVTDYHIFIQNIKAGIYYNLTCTYALLNQKKQAITAFEQAVESGYSEYRHAKTDTDLDNIREEKKFTQIPQLKSFDMSKIFCNDFLSFF